MTDAIGDAKQFVMWGKAALLRALAHVPDDKLEWQPAPTAKSALSLAAHCAVSNRRIAAILSADAGPSGSFQEHVARLQAAEQTITTRERAVEEVEASTQEVLDAIGAVAPDRLVEELETAWRRAPVAFWIRLPAVHMVSHSSQIEYLQTIWGDMEIRRG